MLIRKDKSIETLPQGYTVIGYGTDEFEDLVEEMEAAQDVIAWLDWDNGGRWTEPGEKKNPGGGGAILYAVKTDSELYRRHQEPPILTGKTVAEALEIQDFPFEIRDQKGRIVYCENADRVWMRVTYHTKRGVASCWNSLGYNWKIPFDNSIAETKPETKPQLDQGKRLAVALREEGVLPLKIARILMNACDLDLSQVSYVLHKTLELRAEYVAKLFYRDLCIPVQTVAHILYTTLLGRSAEPLCKILKSDLRVWKCTAAGVLINDLKLPAEVVAKALHSPYGANISVPELVRILHTAGMPRRQIQAAIREGCGIRLTDETIQDYLAEREGFCE